MRSTEAPKIDWKQRIIKDYSIPAAIFSDPVWSQYDFDFEGMHRRLRSTDKLVNKAGRSTWSLNNWLLFSGHLEAVRHGLQSGQIKAETKDKRGTLPTHWAAGSGNKEVLALLLDINPEHASAKSNQGALPIHFAAGNKETLTFLLEKNPEHASTKNNFGCLPIHNAALLGNKECVELLLEKYPEHASAKDNTGTGLIHFTAWSGKKDLVLSLILQHGQDPFAKATGKFKELKDFAEASKNPECLAFCSDLEGLARTYASYFVRQFSQAPEIAERKKLIEKILDTDARVIPHVAQHLGEDFYKTLADDVFKAQEDWEKAYELLVKCAATQHPLAVQTLEASTLDRVNRLCRSLNAKRNFENALKELMELHARMQEAPFQNCCIQAFKKASVFLSGYFQKESSTLLEKITQDPKNNVALKKLEELSKTRPEALICLGRLEEVKAKSSWAPAKFYESARDYYQEAIRKGSAEANYWLGLLHENGHIGKKDIEIALYLYYKASIQFPTAKEKLKPFAYVEANNENRHYVTLANLFLSFSEELIGNPEKCYGNSYLEKAFETDSKYLLTFLHKLLSDFGLSNMPLDVEIRLPLAQFLECKDPSSEELKNYLDVYFKNDLGLDEAKFILKFVYSEYLALYAVNFFHDHSVSYEKRLLVMALAKNSLQKANKQDKDFEETYVKIEKDLLDRRDAIDKIIPPLPSAPPNESTQAAETQQSSENSCAPQKKTFSERLQAIEFPENQIPAELLCDIMCTLMNEPVPTPSGFIIDTETYKTLLEGKGKDPFNENLTLSPVIPKPLVRIKAEIEAFVSKHEQLAKERSASINNNNNEPKKLEVKISEAEAITEKIPEEIKPEKSPETKPESRAPLSALFKQVNSQDAEALADLLPEVPKGNPEETFEKTTQPTPVAQAGF